MRSLALPAGTAILLLAGVAALVVGLYLLRPTPRRLVVSSSLIWQRVLKERKRKPERLRWWLSLLLALAVALSIAAALTRPEIAAVSGRAEQVVLVVDNSATMSARTTDGRTRLDHAVERVREAISAAGAGSRFLVADTMRQLPTPVFEDRDAALTTLGRIKAVSDGQPRFPDVLRSQPAGVPARARFITDGVAGIEPPREVQTISVFQPADNVGITAFDIRAVPSKPGRYEAFIEVLNASSGNKRVELRVAGAGGKVITKPLRVDGRSVSSEVFDVSGFESGPLHATITTDADNFALDDGAFAFLPAKRVVRVALVTRGNPQLQRALELLPRVRLTVLVPERSSAVRGFDVAVFDRYAPKDEPRLPALLIRPQAVGWLPPHAGQITETTIARWDRLHPLLRQLSLRDIAVESADVLKAGAGASAGRGQVVVLATGPREQPLVLASQARVRWVELAFALEESNFVQQASFPVFLANCLDWLTEEPQALSRALGTVQVPATQAKVLDFEGREVKVRQVLGATLFEAAQPGFFTATTEDQRLRLAVNLLDPRVSALNESRLPPQPPASGEAQSALRVAADPWALLLLIAVGLLTIEWLTYNRRVTI